MLCERCATLAEMPVRPTGERTGMWRTHDGGITAYGYFWCLLHTPFMRFDLDYKKEIQDRIDFIFEADSLYRRWAWTRQHEQQSN